MSIITNSLGTFLAKIVSLNAGKITWKIYQVTGLKEEKHIGEISGFGTMAPDGEMVILENDWSISDLTSNELLSVLEVLRKEAI